MQDLAMEFSPEEDIQNVLAKSTPGAPSKAGDATLSLRAEKKVRRNVLCVILLMDTLAARIQKAKQEKMKERRKKSKEKKAFAMAMANARKVTKTVVREGMAGSPSDMDEATHVSKRSKVTSSDLPGEAKNVHRASPQGEARKILTKTGRRKRKETTTFLVPGKSKKRRQMSDTAH